MSDLRYHVVEGGWMVYGVAETPRWCSAASERLEKAMQFVRKFELAIDVGANIGIYTSILASKFNKVAAFEPYERNIICFEHNRDEKFPDAQVFLHRIALSDGEKWAKMAEVDGISAYLTDGEEIGTEMLDSFGYEPDFLKIDAEGYDLKVLKGAIKTLKRCRPVVMVEDKSTEDVRKRHSHWYLPGEIAAFMQSLGYELGAKMEPDFIWVKP